MRVDFDVNEFFEKLEKDCNKVTRHSFSKGETVTTYIEKRNQMCILLKGEADLIRYDFNGNKTIIGHFTDSSIFGEVLYPANTNNELFVLAKTSCEVLFFIYDDILNKCKTSCTFHNEFYQKLTH